MKKLIVIMAVLAGLIGASWDLTPAQADQISQPGHCIVDMVNPYNIPSQGAGDVRYSATVTCNGGGVHNVDHFMVEYLFWGTGLGERHADYLLNHSLLGGWFASSGTCPHGSGEGFQCEVVNTPVVNCAVLLTQGIAGRIVLTEAWKNGTVHQYAIQTTSTPIFDCQW